MKYVAVRGRTAGRAFSLRQTPLVARRVWHIPFTNIPFTNMVDTLGSLWRAIGIGTADNKGTESPRQWLNHFLYCAALGQDVI